MQAIILAAGKGERMRPLTLSTPKPLIKVKNKPLIEYHIEKLAGQGVKNIVINVSWLAEKIMEAIGNGKRWGINIQYSHEDKEPLETGGGILKALPLLDSAESFLVINADIYTDYEFKEFRLLYSSKAHLVLVNNPAHHPEGDFSINDKSFLEYKSNKNKLTYSGIGVYSHSFFDDCKAGKFKLAPLLKTHMDKKLVTGEYFKGQWDDIGTVERLETINKS